MGIQLTLFIFLLIIIFFASKRIVNLLYLLIQKVFGNNKIAVWVLAIVFLPGTVIHEVSHLIMALILRVPTGPISIFPTIQNPTPYGSDKSHPSGVTIKTGHIMVAKTDPIRMTLIGVAPMIVGLMIIYFLGNILYPTPYGSFFNFFTRGEIFQITPRVLIVFTAYLMFITSVTMFSSKQDLKSLLITLPFTILIFSALYISGIKIFIEENTLEYITGILRNLNKGLIVTGIIDYVVLLILVAMNKIRM